jgi:kynurenine formamidase
MTRVKVSRAEFQELFQRVSNWGRWGREDELGALHFLTSERTAEAARRVRSGATVSLSRPRETRAGPDNPNPADHHMTMLADEAPGTDPLGFAKDYVGVDYHNDSHSHIDALCHVAFEGKLYGGRSATSSGHGTIETLKDGLVGRGVLLDIPRLRSLPWLEPGTDVHPGDLEAAEAALGVRVTPGDILLVRTGHAARIEQLGPWDTPNLKAGLHPSAATFLAEREVAALGSDGNNDTAPSCTEDVGFPIHVLALNAMGVHLLDYLWLEGLARRCERERRWEFLFVCAPLRFAGGTGSPVNPIAVF